MTITPAANRTVNICIVFLLFALPLAHIADSRFIKATAPSQWDGSLPTDGGSKNPAENNIMPARPVADGKTVSEDVTQTVNDAGLELLRDASKPWLREALRDPEFRKVAVFEIAQFMEPAYLDLYKLLELDDAGGEALRELLAERFFTNHESLMDGIAKPGARLPDVLGGETRDAKAKYDERIAGLPGEERYAVFVEYEKTMPLRNQIRLLREELAYSAEPLAPEQETALLPALERFFEDDFMMTTMMRSNPLHRPRLTEAEIAALQDILPETQIEEARKVYECQRGSINYSWKPIATRMRRR